MASGTMVIDTDVLSALMRQETVVVSRARAYLADQGSLSISIITRFEILRGLYAKGAARQIAAFRSLCESSVVLPLSDEVVVRAAEIYAELKAKGRPMSDADILIAATALEHGAGVATGNVSHFRQVSGLDVENWLV